jgi:anti-sigma-K factor RskA
MERNRIQELASRYAAGILTQAEQHELEKGIEAGHIDLAMLEGLDTLHNDVDTVITATTPQPSPALDDAFYSMLRTEQAKASRAAFSWKTFFSLPVLGPRLAFASAALVIGIAIGFFVQKPSQPADSKQIAVLSQEVTDLKEMMMLSLLEKESASDRLKAVSLTEDLGQASHKVTEALLQTLNHDENTSVRLAALEALKPYGHDSHVREALIRSIGQQQSPLVQVALAELMAALQAKSSVDALKKIMDDERTPGDIKKKIRQSIDVLT